MSCALVAWLSLNRNERAVLRALANRVDWAESWYLTEHAGGLEDAGLLESKPGSDVGVLAVRITDAGRRTLEAGEAA